MAKTDPVQAARKAVDEAEAAIAKEKRRLDAVGKRKTEHTAEAAGIDPDADPKGFEKGTALLAALTAEETLVRARLAAAEAKAEAARLALTAAENADRTSRLESANAEIKEREARAFAAVRATLEAFQAEVATIGEAYTAASRLEAELKTAGVTTVHAARPTAAAWGDEGPARLAQRLADYMPR